MQNKNYYDILSVSKDANIDEIRAAYKAKAKQYHPDMQINKSLEEKKEAEEKFKEVNEAYETLTNEQKRAQYDMYGYSDQTKTNNNYKSSSEKKFTTMRDDFFNNMYDGFYKTFYGNFNSNQKEKPIDFTDIIELENEINEKKEEHKNLVKISYQKINNLTSVYHDIDLAVNEIVTTLPAYQEALKVITSIEERNKKKITRIFISKEEWENFKKMKEKKKEIENITKDELIKEREEKRNLEREEINQIQDQILNIEKKLKSLEEEYFCHPNKRKYEEEKKKKSDEENKERNRKVI